MRVTANAKIVNPNRAKVSMQTNSQRIGQWKHMRQGHIHFTTDGVSPIYDALEGQTFSKLIFAKKYEKKSGLQNFLGPIVLVSRRSDQISHL
ncbi:MAG: hypothetical protein ABI878_14295 [Acidobacteriota bacterium]